MCPGAGVGVGVGVWQFESAECDGVLHTFLRLN